MKEHLRVDTFKVFPEDDKALTLIMKNEGIKNKSEAYRIALKTYLTLHEAPKQLAKMNEAIQTNNELIQQLYFKLDWQGGQS